MVKRLVEAIRQVYPAQVRIEEKLATPCPLDTIFGVLHDAGETE